MKENSKIGVALTTTFVLATLIGSVATPYMGLATATYGILLSGVFAARRGGPQHRLLMSIGVGGDLLQVLWIEFSRGAIAETVRMELPLLPLLHVVTSASAVVLYLPALWHGTKAYSSKANAPSRQIHRKLGIASLALRTLGYLLMFSLIPFLANRTPNL
jgi:hypothetical protein